jgi:hypothetical protein
LRSREADGAVAYASVEQVLGLVFLLAGGLRFGPEIPHVIGSADLERHEMIDDVPALVALRDVVLP